MIPLLAVNLAVGLARLPVGAFALVTLVGAFPFAALYALAGAQVATLSRPGDVVNAPIFAAMGALAAAPFAAKGVVQWREARRRLAGYAKPRRFDYNLVVIGAGSAGLVSAYVAAAARARVALIEADEMGGECLNTGCIPSKALTRPAEPAPMTTRL